ncbi:MAG: pitrilysin family protein [Actinomycetota bacterium]
MSAIATAYPKIEFTDEKLKNGLRLIMSVERLVPIVAVNLWYSVGSRNEAPGKTGLAHLFEHMMFEGSAHLKKGDHFKHVQSMGGQNNASTSAVRTNYFEWAPSHGLETMLWLEADRMGGLLEALNQETLDNQRDVVKNERRQTSENQPYGTWIEETTNNLFAEGHPYHHTVIGSMDDLDAASLKDVKAFFSSHYAPNNAVLSIVGDFDPKQAREWVVKYFGKIPANKKIPPTPDTEVPFDLGGEARKSIRDRVPAPGVFISYRSPADGTRENDVMTVAGAVLSVGFGSRMYQRLVREQYAIQAQFFTNAQPGVSWSAAFGVAAPGIFNEVLETEMLKVIDSLKTEPVTDEELARAKAQLESQIIARFSTVASRADSLSENASLFGDPGRVNDQLSELMSITPEEISKVASEVFTKENRAVITYLPKPAEVKDKRKGR